MRKPPVCRISYIFLTRAQPAEMRRIQSADISVNKSDIVWSHDRIPEIKMATAMLKVANAPECYHARRERKHRIGTYCSCELYNTDAKLTSRINNVPTST
jgi:predicted secreted Zn-dependent protease